MTDLVLAALAAFGVVFVAELGDKTQIASATLAARSKPVGVWIGATAGEVASGMLGVAAGAMIGDRIPGRVLRWGSATLFILFGVAMLAGWP